MSAPQLSPVATNAASLANDPALIESGFIFERSTATGPSAVAEVHATTIVETSAGLVAAWFGGSKEGKTDVVIWLLRRSAEGAWSEPVEVANGKPSDENEPRVPAWNPVLFQPRNGPLMLFYKVGADIATWRGELKTSDDGGLTWSDARSLPPGFYGPIKNKPFQRADGALLCPSSDEVAGWTVHFELTEDLGLTWKKIGPINEGVSIQAIQPSILDCGDGRLMAIGRTRQNRLFETCSTDGGLNWSPMTLGLLPNNNSGTDAVTLADGRHLVVYNHACVTPGEWGGPRTPLNVAISSDAQHWSAALVLETEPGEYSYPAIIQSADGLVHITYTWKRQAVKHVVIDPLRLSARPLADV